MDRPLKATTKATIGAVLLGATLLAFPGCEDTGVTAPSGSTITLVASPSSVSINQEAGETFGTTTIIAQLLGEGGQPLQNVPLFFNSSGGLLGSVNNFCVPSTGVCSRSPDACVFDSDCPFVAPEAVITNNEGIALDVLTLRLIEDPTSVEVTAQSTASTSTVTVGQNVNTGPIDPVASIVAQPPNGQRTGSSFSFDGTGSTFDPLVNLTCFEWTITSSLPMNDQVLRGVTESIITLSYGSVNDVSAEQDLSVQLRVSDVPGIPCTDNNAPPPGSFSIFSAVIPYQIRCDFTDPLLEAGSNQFVSLNNLPTVSVNLTSSASDPESQGVLTYWWDCGNGAQNFEPGQSVSCIYDTTGSFGATAWVENACGLRTSDTLTVTVNP